MSCLPWMINLEAILKLHWGPYEFPNQEKKDKTWSMIPKDVTKRKYKA